MVPFPSLGKLLAYDLMIKAAIMRHAFIYVSSIGTTNGTVKRTSTGTSAFRNDLRVLDMEVKNVTSYERPLVLVMIAQPLALPGSCDYICASSRSDLMSSDVLTRLPQVRANFGSIHSCVSHIHVPPRSPCASCPAQKK